jgi:hypothetical protein
VAIGCSESDAENFDLAVWMSNNGKIEETILTKVETNIINELQEALAFRNSADSPALDAIVLGLNSMLGIYAWYERLIRSFLWDPFLPDRRALIAELIFRWPQIVWYLHGNFVEWLEMLTKPLYFTEIVLETDVFKVGGYLHIVKESETDQLYMRIFSETASSTLRDYRQLSQRRGYFKAMDDVMLSSYRDRIEAATYLITSMWEEF